MKSNLGYVDRLIRISVGLVMVSLAATNSVGLWGWLGLIPLATGLARFCPFYSILGFNSCGKCCAMCGYDGNCCCQKMLCQTNKHSS